MLLGAHQRDLRRALDALADELPGPLNDEGERGIEDVRRREPVVEPATVGAEIRRDGVHERRDVVVRDALSLRDRAGLGTRARSRTARALADGTTPASAQASRTASSTACHCSSFASSDQTLDMAGLA